jgi:hypothetical protein
MSLTDDFRSITDLSLTEGKGVVTIPVEKLNEILDKLKSFENSRISLSDYATTEKRHKEKVKDLEGKINHLEEERYCYDVRISLHNKEGEIVKSLYQKKRGVVKEGSPLHIYYYDHPYRGAVPYTYRATKAGEELYDLIKSTYEALGGDNKTYQLKTVLPTLQLFVRKILSFCRKEEK